ncbi:ATP-grasp domain-containing protein [Nocardioides flavescens]|uniref:ATP-grasp domain-containing protein n=1 Tax=Nocardioides flavescens TaxID=2691959 RepID=A0A6L7EWL8_9ACTN|nr:ATP-grasp domain-containing protein [Nocardioides flavescens]MXG88409.1 ATP-grasp domain-containing protein [Nocardioides flavescens]
MTVWLLEREVFADEHERLATAAEAAGDRVVRWRDEWWSDGRWPELGAGPVVFHGALENADRVHRERPWSPGAFCATERFACSAWWPQVADLLVAERHAVTTVAQLVAEGPPEEFGPRVFVRPDSALKPFSGRVLDRDAVNAAALDHGFYYDDERLPVVVTPVVDVGEEWRFVVAGGEVVAGSGYVADGREQAGSLGAGHPAWAYAETVVARLSAPEPVFVVDVCETPRGLRLLELNPFSGADLYDCDRGAVVAAVDRVVESA